MAIHYRTNTLILKKRDQGEADRVFTMYTEKFGKIDLRAVSERKINSKLRGGLELFYVSDVEFIQGKFFKILTDAVIVERHGNIREDLIRLRIAYRVSELMDRIVHGQEADKNIWKLLREVFETLNQNGLSVTTYKLLPYYFLWNLLSHSGYRPLLDHPVLEKEDQKTIYLIKLFLSQNVHALSELQISEEGRKMLRTTSYNYLTKIF
ncbi:DNA repair protein RecO [Patescibacteria group bacterium]|nr:DNA repair protein RecO [Patescibacteria group bacterium]